MKKETELLIAWDKFEETNSGAGIEDFCGTRRGQRLARTIPSLEGFRKRCTVAFVLFRPPRLRANRVINQDRMGTLGKSLPSLDQRRQKAVISARLGS